MKHGPSAPAAQNNRQKTRVRQSAYKPKECRSYIRPPFEFVLTRQIAIQKLLQLQHVFPSSPVIRVPLLQYQDGRVLPVDSSPILQSDPIPVPKISQEQSPVLYEWQLCLQIHDEYRQDDIARTLPSLICSRIALLA